MNDSDMMADVGASGTISDVGDFDSSDYNVPLPSKLIASDVISLNPVLLTPRDWPGSYVFTPLLPHLQLMQLLPHLFNHSKEFICSTHCSNYFIDNHPL